MNDEETLFTFPCMFPIKIMGICDHTFKESILIIARKHIPHLKESSIQSKVSKTGKYLSITITFQAESRDQLDELYRELSAHDAVKMVL